MSGCRCVATSMNPESEVSSISMRTDMCPLSLVLTGRALGRHHVAARTTVDALRLSCGWRRRAAPHTQPCRSHPTPEKPLQLETKVIRMFVSTDKAPTRAFSWLKAATTAFTFNTLLRHYAKQVLTPRSLNVKLGPRRNYHKGRAAIRHYANQTARPL